MPSSPSAPPDSRPSARPVPARADWIASHAFAHRGLHGAGVPENSRLAFARALAAGHGIELDVRLAGDGQAVVFHDATLDRLTRESGPLARRSAAQLGALALAGSGETIPTLRQVLADVAGRAPVLIEIKSGRGERVAALCLAVRRVIEGYTGAHAVMSFDPRVARWFRIHSPHTVRGLVVSQTDDGGVAGFVRRHLASWQAQPDFLAIDVRDLPSRFAAAHRRRGRPLATWTVRSDEQARAADACADARIFEIVPGEGRAAA